MPKKVSDKPKNTCAKKTTKKYAKRDSPPYSGTECCGKQKKGNDGKEYVSKRAADGSCRWHLMKTRSQKKTMTEGCS